MKLFARVGLVAVVLAAGCGDDDDTADRPPTTVTSTTSNTSTTSTTPAPTPPLGPLADVTPPDDWPKDLQGRIAFTAGGPFAEDIYVIDADGTHFARVTNDPGAMEFDPTWSPDGRHIAYRHQARDNEDTAEIWVMDADGSHKRALTDNDRPDWGPVWSPDGATIAFNAGGSPHTFGLGLVRPDGSGTHVVEPEVWVEYADWSPDGKRVVFMGTSGRQYDIFTMNADGTGVTRLTDNPADDGWPVWSPDGRTIAFSSQRGLTDEGQRLYLMDADGSDERQVPIDRFAQFPAWSPDGRYLLFGPGLNLVRPDGTGLTELSTPGAGDTPLLLDWVAPQSNTSG